MKKSVKGVAHILEDITSGLWDLFHMEPESRPISLMDRIKHLSEDNLEHLGIVGGSLLKRQGTDYKVIKQFGEHPALRTGTTKRQTSLPVQELSYLCEKHSTPKKKVTPVIYRYSNNNAPNFLKNKTLIGLQANGGKNFDYIVLLKQKNRFRGDSELVKNTMNHLATIAQIAIEKGGKYQDVKTTARRQAEVLNAAHVIQKGILPTKPPSFKGYDLAAACIPAEAVGGDYINYLPLGSIYSMVLVDIESHDLPASLRSNTVHDLLWAFKDLRPEMAIKKINQRIVEAREQYRATMVSFELSEQGTVSYCISGHEYPILFSGRKKTELKIGACPLGIDEDYEVPVSHFSMKSGDVFVVYSDGITDAFDKTGMNQWGQDRLKRYVGKNLRASADDIVQGIFGELEGFRGKGTYTDDASIIVAKKL